jgi:sugar phosphate permease
MTEIARPRVYYGWWIASISTFALMIGNGLTIGGLPAFTNKMIGSLIAGGAIVPSQAPALIGGSASLMILLAGLASPLVGWLTGRLDLRWIMATGCLVLGAGLVTYSRITTPTHVYLAYGLYGLSLALVGVMVNTVLITNWFDRSRGRAMGVVITGTSFGGVLIPLSANLLAGWGLDWRETVLLLSASVIALLLAVLFFVRTRPEEMGLTIDGRLSPEREPATLRLREGATFKQAIGTSLFWALGICAAAIFYAIFTSSQQFIQYLKSPRIGMSEALANTAQSLTFVASVGGKFFFGWLSDKIPRTRAMAICCGLMFAGSLILISLTTATAFSFILIFGFGYGGTFVLIQLLAVGAFGPRAMGKILGAITFLETLGSALGTAITGKLAASDGGDYTRAFYGVILASAIALATALIVHFKSKSEG